MLNAHVPESTLTSRGVHPLHCGQRPILLLHGFLSTPGILISLAGRLRRWGYCAHGVDLGGVFGRYNARPIEHIAGMIAERVEELADDHGCERIDVIGHSEGGISGRYYVQRLNGSRRVSRLVTLGTPHRGTRWAYVGYVFGQLLPSLPQMAPGSSLLRDLGDDSFPIGVHLTSIYSRHAPSARRPRAGWRRTTERTLRTSRWRAAGTSRSSSVRRCLRSSAASSKRPSPSAHHPLVRREWRDGIVQGITPGRTRRPQN